MTVKTGQEVPTAIERRTLASVLRATRLAPSRAMLLVLIGLAAEIAVMYGRSINNGFVGDDWPLLDTGSHGVAYTVHWFGGYHYNPIPQFFMLVLLQVFGLRPLVFHIAAYLLFWLDAVLILLLGRRITGRFAVGALAGALFIAFGSQFEAVIWGLVALEQTMGLAVYLAGLLLYMRAHDPHLDQKRRNQAYIGFVIALVLAPFIYEQTISLIVACALYRLLVMEDKAGFSQQALLARAKAWVRDFAVPSVFLVCYLSLKWWMGHQTAIPMTPGLSLPWQSLVLVATKGFFNTFIPGLGPRAATWLVQGWIGNHYLRFTAAELLALAAGLVLLKPVYRFLLALTAILLVFSTLGLGAIASRHLHLILAPSAILWAGFLVYLAARMRSWLAHTALPDVWVARLAAVPAIVIAIAFSIAGFRYAAVQQDAWTAAANTVQDAVTSVGLYAWANPTATTLYIVNLPDSSASPTGDTVYLFHNVPPLFVTLPYPGRFKDVVVVRTYTADQAYSTLVTKDQIAQWSRQPGTLVLWYDDSTRELTQWRAGSALLATPAAEWGKRA